MTTWKADAGYTRVIEQHGGTLLHLAVLLTGNLHDAEDVVQDVLISVASAWPDGRPRAVLAYLKKSVTNRAINLVTRRRELPSDTIPDAPTADLGFLRYEEDKRFFALVDTLPLKQRATLILRYYADMDDRTIAGILDCTVQTVRSQAHHGLAKLRADDRLADVRQAGGELS